MRLGFAIACLWAFPGGTVTTDKVCDVTQGPWTAKGDNRTEDTQAVQAAVNACSPGGMVLLPAGKTFLLRPIQLPSHSNLHVEGNVSAWREISTWPNSTFKRCPMTPYETPRDKIVTAPQASSCTWRLCLSGLAVNLESLFWSANSSQVTITGGGTIDGGGPQWWRRWANHSGPDNYWHNCRPSLVEFGRRAPYYDSGVADVVVRGVTLKDSPFWTFSGRGLKRALIQDVHVTTEGCGYSQAPNTDGFNIQGEDIEVLDSTVHNGDDCVPIFPPTRNVTVRNITCECGNGLVPVVWPSMSVPGEGGDISNVLFEGAVFRKTSQAVVIKSLSSFVGTASNVTYRDFTLIGVKSAVFLNMYGQSEAAQGQLLSAQKQLLLPQARNIVVQNVSGTASSAGEINCGPGPLACSGIQMDAVDISPDAPGKTMDYKCQNADGTQHGCQPVPCGW
eukprot:gene11794-2149_t